ncbi:MAG: hypothetical protein K0U47_06680 [Epsilonproteobacteria bacterium]|nr:hypothetical protein [Campylobacterota bacterium]
MKIVKITSIFLVVFSINLFASDVQGLVNQIKNAEPSQRRELMNTLKIKLRGMNQASRDAAMLDLKRTFAQGKKTMPSTAPMVDQKKRETTHTKPQLSQKNDSYKRPQPPNIIRPPHKDHLRPSR